MTLDKECRKRSLSYKHSFVENKVWRCFSNRQCGMIVTMLLFATLTSVQLWAASIAKSLALFSDCGSMTVDTLSYATNLWAECVVSEHQQRNQLIATPLSIFVLFGFTGYIIYYSCNILFGDQLVEHDVNAYIVFGFGAAGLSFDLVGFYMLRQGKKEKSTSAGDLNLYSAGIHVISDFMRNITTILEGILIWYYNFESTTTDAWATLIVSGLILLPCAEMIREWLKECLRYRGREKKLTPLLEKEVRTKSSP